MGSWLLWAGVVSDPILGRQEVGGGSLIQPSSIELEEDTGDVRTETAAAFYVLSCNVNQTLVPLKIISRVNHVSFKGK